MRVELAYGRSGLAVEVPKGATVVTPAHPRAGVPGEALVRQALAAPVAGPRLSELAAPGMRVAVAVCDATRPQPRAVVLGAILDELAGTVADEDVVVLVATGTHRASTPAEREAMLSRRLLDRVAVLDHDAADPAGLVGLPGARAAVPVALSRAFMEADLRITTGLVEPHLFAGFSGGPKLVAPGLAGQATIFGLHDAGRIGHPSARYGVLEGNPVHEDVVAVAAAAGVDFACDVVLGAENEVVACFAGELFAMHASACRAARAAAMVGVEDRFDVVLTTNAGYPLDQNLYQGVKGMAAAAEIVRPGGLILLAAACEDGFPDGSAYHRLLTSAASPASLAAEIAGRAETLPDQWQVQVQARVQSLARVGVHTSGCSPDDLRAAHLEPVADLAAALLAEADRRGEGVRVCVLPEGSRTIPFVTEDRAGRRASGDAMRGRGDDAAPASGMLG